MAVPQRHPRPTPIPPVARPRPHLQPAPTPRRQLMSLVGWAVAVTVVVALFALALFHAVIVDRQTTLDGLNTQLEDVRVENEKLRLNVARAEAPTRIMAEARLRLKMVEPGSRVYLSPVELAEGGAG